MKSIRSILFAAAITMLIYSCEKEGPQGPEGPAGSQGAQGPQGNPGNTGTANVIYSGWFNLPGAWTGSGSPNAYFDKAAPGITQAVMDQGVVLAYMKLGGETIVRPLPATTFSGQVIWNFILTAPGNIRFTVNPANGTSNFSPATNMQYRYVIIPGGQAGGRVASSQQGSYAAEQLRSMSYEEVMKLFNIPETGNNTK